MANQPQGNQEEPVEESLTDDELLEREAARLEQFHEQEDQDGDEEAPGEESDQQGGDPADEEDGEPVPSSDESDEDSVQDDEGEQDDPGESEGQPNDEDPDEDQLPPDSKKRTKDNFDKVLTKNRDYRRKLIAAGIDPDADDAEEQLRSRTPQAGGASVYDTVYGRGDSVEQAQGASQTPPGFDPQAAGQVQQIANQNPDVQQPQFNELVKQNLTTDEDGNQVVNLDGLAAAVQQANQNAVQQAQEAASAAARNEISRHEESRQLKEAYQEFPQLDPHNANFDKSFYDRTVAFLVQKHEIEGRKDVPLVEIAREVDGLTGGGKASQDDQQPRPKKPVKRVRQGPIERGGGAPRKGTRRSVDQLRAAQKQGGRTADQATLERLERSGHFDD